MDTIKRLLKRLWPWLVIIGLMTLLVSQRQSIYDWTRLRGYTPPPRIVELADNTAMTDEGRHIFYVYHPSLEDKQAFNEHCGSVELTIVLGCYAGGRGIYIYDVKEPRLAGVHEVTAAHEMLHAAYDRLNNSQKREIGKQLNDFYATITDERVKNSVEAYRGGGDETITNELHSIIPTEVRDIPAELENYYKRYFNDRRKVVAYAESYEGAFVELKNRVAVLDAELAKLKSQIDANTAALNALAEELKRDRQQMDDMLAAGDTAGYNAAVPAYNAKVRRYNNLANATRALIERYNRLVEERNALAIEQKALHDALDSRLESKEQE